MNKQQKVTRSAQSAKTAGLWFVWVNGELWEAWAWTANDDKPPKALHEEGWRFQRA